MSCGVTRALDGSACTRSFLVPTMQRWHCPDSTSSSTFFSHLVVILSNLPDIVHSAPTCGGAQRRWSDHRAVPHPPTQSSSPEGGLGAAADAAWGGASQGTREPRARFTVGHVVADDDSTCPPCIEPGERVKPLLPRRVPKPQLVFRALHRHVTLHKGAPDCRLLHAAEDIIYVPHD